MPRISWKLIPARDIHVNFLGGVELLDVANVGAEENLSSGSRERLQLLGRPAHPVPILSGEALPFLDSTSQG